ncbi:MAG TPA: hypothetical protein VMV09_05650 [Candidatus Saccharimonadales bacterium]|nr:hypothetical protein [Candidatus Saccharimonadales bacterium]
MRRLVPNPLRSWEEYQRSIHADLLSMSPALRHLEAARIRLALIWRGEIYSAWLLERLERLEADRGLDNAD